MNLILLMSVFIIAFIFFMIIIGWFIYDKSFRNIAFIARQNGKNISDVIWIKDKFKVINRGGQWIIKFKKMPEKTNSFEGEFWTNFSKNNKKIISMSREEWDSREMTKLIQRGLFLYETSEGVFFPMNIIRTEDTFNFKIIDQDNRQFIINEMKNINELTKDTQKMFISIIAIIVGIVIMGAVFFGGLYFLHKESVEGIQQNNAVCSQYITAFLNVTNQDQRNNFITNLLPGG